MWPHVRAGLVALAIVLGLVDGCPLPEQRYVKPWQRGMVDTVRPIQRAIIDPVRWVTRTWRFSQRWALMQGARRDRFRFTVEGKHSDGTWELLYRANDSEHALLADQLERHRVSGTWSPTDRLPGQYSTFVSWLAARIFDLRADIITVRASQEKVQLAGGALVSTGAFTVQMTIDRAELLK